MLFVMQKKHLQKLSHLEFKKNTIVQIFLKKQVYIFFFKKILELYVLGFKNFLQKSLETC